MLAAATRGLSALRAAAKPLHPEGEVRTGHLRRDGADLSGHRSGVPWLDEPGEDQVEIRRSRAIGLPGIAPDIHGLAIRVRGAGAPADLLLASTGAGRVTRFVLTASRDPGGRPLTTLLPYRTTAGPVLIAARATAPDTYRLSWARGAGTWHPFATLHLTGHRGDPDISFDPLLHRPPGLEQYQSVVRLRGPAYIRARRSR